jgi:hypothetical protein
LLSADPAEVGPQAAGRIIQARVEDAAVVAALVYGNVCLLVDDEDVKPWFPIGEPKRRGQADQPRTYNNDVVAAESHTSADGRPCYRSCARLLDEKWLSWL